MSAATHKTDAAHLPIKPGKRVRPSSLSNAAGSSEFMNGLYSAAVGVAITSADRTQWQTGRWGAGNEATVEEHASISITEFGIIITCGTVSPSWYRWGALICSL